MKATFLSYCDLFYQYRISIPKYYSDWWLKIFKSPFYPSFFHSISACKKSCWVALLLLRYNWSESLKIVLPEKFFDYVHLKFTKFLLHFLDLHLHVTNQVDSSFLTWDSWLMYSAIWLARSLFDLSSTN